MARTAAVGQHVALGDADARFVGLEIDRVEKLDRVRGHHRQIERGRQIERPHNKSFLLRVAGALQLDVIALGEQCLPLGCKRQRQLHVVLQQCLADIPVERAGQQDQPLGAGRQPAAPDFGTTAMLVGEVGLGQKFA
ncbi:hypothetical protein GALL_326730 [mine drainage metagenome]|uniref:Uncharacterized protein n=1 Tax=mine drainage metagenome TaxID=410659 RepID=A0A1J5R708_9ZZZZ